MKSFFLKLMSVLLCFSLMVPLVTVSASAVTAEAILVALGLITAAGGAVESLASATSSVTQMLSDIQSFLGDSSQDSCNWIASSAWIGAEGNRCETTKEVLAWLVQDWNDHYASRAGFNVYLTEITLDDGTVYSAIRCILDGVGGSRGDLSKNLWLLCDGYGRVLCSNDTSDMDGHWEPFYKPDSLYVLRSYEDLYNKAQEIGGYLVHYKEYWVISSNDGERGWFSPDGLRLAARYSDNSWASNQDRPDTSVKDENGNPAVDENGNIIDETNEGNNTNIDLSGMTITLPDGSINFIDKIIYDESTKSYHIDSHDTYNYTTNNYYEWNYYINYTSITYIGQTEEYNKYYEVYYELPDGRDSADLTKEEVEQLNVSVDVLPYSRAVDDVSLKSLYHFDGNTRDSSYWNYRTDFTWNSGPSVTYMDSGVFDGALYLDETEHDFTLLLPCFVGSDFTLQWRYYQSYTAAPVTDSYLSIGGSDILFFNGAVIKDASGSVLCSIPIGSWNEICLTGSDGMAYLYFNGLKVASWSFNSYNSNLINFHFGSEQQTFKYLDELRFVSKDLYNSGASYTPTSVPYDTNLILVVPDSENIIADEWHEWILGSDVRLVYDFSSGDDTNLDGLGFLSDGANFDVDFEFTEDGLLMTRTDDSEGIVDSGAAGLVFELNSLPRQNAYYYVYAYNSQGKVIFYYYFRVRLVGESQRPTFDVLTYSLNGVSWRASSDNEQFDAILYPTGKDTCISRVEFAYSPGGSYVPKTSTYVKHSTLSAVDSSGLNVPSLAVRTDLDITSHHIGGVRPTLPEKGMVWAMVENERITSIQIYNGQAWEGVDGRIWTGERWVPASSYNIITLQDMYDIVDSTPNYEYIYSEAGFWSWWQKSWNAFVERFFASGGTGGTSSVPSSVKDALSQALSTLIESVFGLITEVLKTLIGAAMDLISGIFSFLSETVLGGIKAFFGVFTDGSLLEGFQQTGEDGSTTIGLPEGVPTVFAFFSGFFMLLPAELRTVLFFGMGLLLLLAVFKMVRE